MSFRKSKLDLLVRVRYSNPLPAPPCPPKFLDIPTDPMRYARPEFLDDLANETPFPMIVDGDLGMPIDLSQWEGLWGESGDDAALNPDPLDAPLLDPKDQFLLEDPGAYNGFSTSVSGTSTPAAPLRNVAWLRKTEYLSRETSSRSPIPQETTRFANNTPIDVSRAAQIRDIEASFAAIDNTDLDTLKHPNKPEVTAVEAFEVLPDAEIWANAYDLFRFSERPGERPPDVDDPRLDCAILRPMESDGEHFLAYYLTKEDDAAVEFKQARLTRPPDAPQEDEPTPFHFVRDYETVKIEQEVPNEFLIVLDDGEDVQENDMFEDEQPLQRRAKGAYYKNIERKMVLKKKRQNSYQEYMDKWDVVKVTHVPMDKDEEDEREEALAEVMDPMYLLSRGEADAEGEVDDGQMITGEDDVQHADAMEVFGEP